MAAASDAPELVDADVVVVGGGAAGLWLLDALRRRGDRALLLESAALGQGQTVASQGIIHGGLKYTLTGLLTPSAKAIRDMPLRWRRCLAGEAAPDLSRVRLRAEYCHLWQTTSLRSRVAMIGARAGLAVTPAAVPEAERPEALRRCPGVVARLDEQVVEPVSFLCELARPHAAALLRIDARSGFELACTGPGAVERIRLIDPESGRPLDVRPGVLVLAAGGGNASLREAAGLSASCMQRRPLHMVVARGADLPIVNGHCVDGMSTRVTLTTTRDVAGRRVWQIGGQVAEEGVELDAAGVIDRARRELEAVLPGVDLAGVEWGAYRVDRAEAETRSNERPGDANLLREGNVITTWPTKLALVPRLVDRVLEAIPPAAARRPATPASPPTAPSPRTDDDAALPAPSDPPPPPDWPRPPVATPPWELDETWNVADSAAAASR